MSQAQVKFEANDKITIDGKQYRVADHPALPGIPYVQRGARGFVTQLIAPNGEKMALKYFKIKYRVPELVEVAEALKQYAGFAGLRAAGRTVFTRATHPELLVRYPALEYGVLMPWLPGPTWYDIITTKVAISPQESAKLAQETSRVLANLEANQLAHCDIAGANVLVDRKNTGIEFVDIEELYGPNQPEPVERPAGQDGYQHREGREKGQWNQYGDRFGAAVMIAEMLGWSDGRLRQNSADEHFFSAAEMQDRNSARFHMISEVLKTQFSEAIADTFAQAWHSARLEDCPPLSHWQDILAEIEVEGKSSQPMASPVVSARRAIGTNDSPPVAPSLQTEGTKLCRNCGMENYATDSFCKRCGFYIGTGARRAKPPVKAAESASQQTPQPPQPVISTGTQPQQVPLNRDTHSIVTARRVGGTDGQPLQRISTHDQTPATVEGNMGQWIVPAVIFGVILAVILIALIGG